LTKAAFAVSAASALSDLSILAASIVYLAISASFSLRPPHSL